MFMEQGYLPTVYSYYQSYLFHYENKSGTATTANKLNPGLKGSSTK